MYNYKIKLDVTGTVDEHFMHQLGTSTWNVHETFILFYWKFEDFGNLNKFMKIHEKFITISHERRLILSCHKNVTSVSWSF